MNNRVGQIKYRILDFVDKVQFKFYLNFSKVRWRGKIPRVNNITYMYKYMNFKEVQVLKLNILLLSI